MPSRMHYIRAAHVRTELQSQVTSSRKSGAGAVKLFAVGITEVRGTPREGHGTEHFDGS